MIKGRAVRWCDDNSPSLIERLPRKITEVCYFPVATDGLKFLMLDMPWQGKQRVSIIDKSHLIFDGSRRVYGHGEDFKDLGEVTITEAEMTFLLSYIEETKKFDIIACNLRHVVSKRLFDEGMART